MKKLKKCSLCGSKEFTSLYKAHDSALNIKKTFNLDKCKNCKIIFLNPQPSFKELKEHYPKKYYSLKGIRLKETYKRSKWRIFLYNLYFNPKNKKPVLRTLMLPWKSYLRGTVINPNAKILDVGSGSGQFLYEMKQLGIECFGVEPSKFDEKSSKKQGLQIKNVDLLSAKYPKDNFDLVTMNHVLEHVPNPQEIIKEVHKILRKGGRFIVAVPNNSSLAHRIFKKNWYQLDVPRHLFHFSEKILAKELIGLGFRIEKVRHNSRPSQFSISLKRKFNWKINTKILNLFFFPLTWLVNLTKQGDAIEIWAIK